MQVTKKNDADHKQKYDQNGNKMKKGVRIEYSIIARNFKRSERTDVSFPVFDIFVFG